MIAPDRPAVPTPNEAQSKDIVVRPSVPRFMAQLSKYRKVLNADNLDLRVVNACIYQLEERKDLLKKQRDNADTQGQWKRSQAVTSWTGGLPSLFTFAAAVFALLRTNLSHGWMAFVIWAALIIWLFQAVYIVLSFRESSHSWEEPASLEAQAEELGDLLSSFRTRKNELEAAAEGSTGDSV